MLKIVSDASINTDRGRFRCAPDGIMNAVAPELARPKNLKLGQLKMENHVRRKDQLVMPGAVVVRPLSVRVVKTKFGPNSNKLVGPPGYADGMLGIVRGEASPAADLVVKIFVTHG